MTVVNPRFGQSSAGGFDDLDGLLRVQRGPKSKSGGNETKIRGGWTRERYAKAFLQTRVKEAERDALRFHWIKHKSTEELEVLRFTKVVFGLAPFPFLLDAVIQQHLESVLSE